MNKKTTTKKPKSTEINPKHYQFKLRGVIYNNYELIEALFADDAHLSHALKYLMRVGRKPTAPYLLDLGKCLWWVARAMMFHGAKTIELPPDAPIRKDT